MLPSAILFDLDDTLFDHQYASGMALTAMHATYAPDLAFAPFAIKHAEILEHFHARFLMGEFTLAEARVARMQALFAAFDRDINADIALLAANHYREQHQANRRLLDGALELLDALRGKCKLGIVTNNSAAEQIEKLRALGIAEYFEAVVISEAVGVAKPDAKIFTIALQRLRVDASDAVFIGDNWINDIVGAISVGMHAVWLNRNKQTPAQARLSEQKDPKHRTSAGVGNSNVPVIDSLSPLAVAIDAINIAFNHRTPGAKKYGQLETLAS